MTREQTDISIKRAIEENGKAFIGVIFNISLWGYYKSLTPKLWKDTIFENEVPYTDYIHCDTTLEIIETIKDRVNIESEVIGDFENTIFTTGIVVEVTEDFFDKELYYIKDIAPNYSWENCVGIGKLKEYYKEYAKWI